MKTLTNSVLTVLLCAVPLLPAVAQFDSGSDGSDGPLDVTADTALDLPPDGIFHFTTVNVASGATLTFNPNDLNTPVRLLATDVVTVAGTIDLSGEPQGFGIEGLGGPGGFRGGKPGLSASSIPPGAGLGPGGGGPQTGITIDERAGAGTFAVKKDQSNPHHGEPYGTPLLLPLIGGSGGGGGLGNPGLGGGGGGGALLIASSTSISVTGTIDAQGGFLGNNPNTGSGGGIRLVAPQITGDGTLDVFPNTNHGRIRIDALDRSAMDFVFRPVPAATIGVAMISMPDPLPRLDLLDVAGTALAPGTTMPVAVTLPFGSDPNQSVLVQASDFGTAVPVRVALIPEHGPATTVDAVIDNQADNPAQTTVDLTFPVGVPTSIQVWTR